MSRFAPSHYWQSIVDGPMAPMMFQELLSSFTPLNQTIEFAMKRISGFESLLGPIEKDVTVFLSGKRRVELRDEAVFQLLQILHSALYNKHGVKGHDVYQRYTVKFFRRLPDVALDENSKAADPVLLLAYPETKKHILSQAIATLSSAQIPNSKDRSLLQFLANAYIGTQIKNDERGAWGRRDALGQMQQYIEGIFREHVWGNPERILQWIQGIDLPMKLREILLIACLKKSELTRVERLFRSSVTAT